MKPLNCALIVTGLAALFLADTLTAQTVLYREVFPTEATSSCSGDKSSCQSDIVADDWYAAQQGDTVDPMTATTQDLQQIPEGAPSSAGSGNEPTAINSGAADADGTTGAALYEPSERFGVFLFTDEYSVASTSVGVVRFEARNDMDDTTPLNTIDAMGNQSGPVVSATLYPTMRPAFCIGNTWYVASTDGGQNTTSPTAWLSFEFALAGLTFEVAPTGTSCLDLPTMPRTLNLTDDDDPSDENPHATVDRLPSGNIDAFGIYWDKNWATDSTAPGATRNVGTLGQVRIDNFELAGPLTPVESCTGADLGNSDMLNGGGFFDPSTSDFTMSGTGCTEQGVDSVLCFTPENSCDVRITCARDSGLNSVNVFTGACTAVPAMCSNTASGTGSASVDVTLSAGVNVCVVCEYAGTGGDSRMAFSELSGDCGQLPVDLQSFSISE
ncbi:MAG: hypothetical protein AAF560_08470 [Acidobacteriota bacterium]